MALGFNFLAGWLAQRWPMGRLLGLAMLVLAGAMLALPHLETMTHVYLYAVAMAFAGGTVTVVFFAFWAHAYGPAHVGQIQGVAQMLTVVASAVGPLLLAASKERYGTYAPLFQGLALAAALFAPCVWLVLVPKPTRSDNP
jgi:MFS family permease